MVCHRKFTGEKKTVAIVGAGYAGMHLAKELDSSPEFHVYLIDRKDYFLHNVGALRASVVPGFANHVILPYHSLLKNGTFVHTEVTSIKGSSVQVSGQGQPVAFDYIVIATGATFGFPSKVQAPSAKDALREYATAVEQLRNAGKKIVIIGGGPVACELAGEIKAQHPDKEVTIATKSDRLLDKNKPEKFVSRVEQCIEKQGIKILRNASPDISQFSGQSVISGPVKLHLASGDSIDADLVYICIGVTKMNNSSFLSEFPVDQAGRLKVNEFFQVEGRSDVFAIGDAIQINEDHLAAYTGNHAKTVATNLLALFNGKALKPYKPAGYSTMIIPIGPKTGVSLLMGHTMGSFFTKLIKAKSLFAGMYAGMLGIKIPVTEDSFEAPPSKGHNNDEILKKLLAT